MKISRQLAAFLISLSSFFVSLSALKANRLESSDIYALQLLRAKHAPKELKHTDRAYRLIDKLGDTKDDKLAAAKELINWLFVEKPPPGTTEQFTLLDIYPAATSLIALGHISTPLLQGKLQEDVSEEHAELILSCLKRILKEKAADEIRLIANQTSAPNVKKAAEAVLQNKETKTDSGSYYLLRNLAEHNKAVQEMKDKKEH